MITWLILTGAFVCSSVCYQWTQSIVETCDSRIVIDSKVKKFLVKKWAGSLYGSFIKYWKMFWIKPELAVCIAVTETGLWKNMSFKGNIGNVGSHQAREFKYEDWTPDINRWIKAIYQVALNWKNLDKKTIVGDLYTNGDCKHYCKRYYASWKGAQKNVTQCLTEIYWKKIWPNFNYRIKK
jgi:hypothetical protein